MQDLRGIEAVKYEIIFKKFDDHKTYNDFVKHYDSIKKELNALDFVPNLEYQKKLAEKNEFYLKAKNETIAFKQLLNDSQNLQLEAQKENNPLKIIEALKMISKQKNKMNELGTKERWAPEQIKLIHETQTALCKYFIDKDWIEYAKNTNSLSDFDQRCNEIINAIQTNVKDIISVSPIELAPRNLREQNTTCKKIDDLLRNLPTESSLDLINEELPTLLKKWKSLKVLSIRWHDEEVSRIHNKLLKFTADYLHSENFNKELSIIQNKHAGSKSVVDKKIILLKELVYSLKDKSLSSDFEAVRKKFFVEEKSSGVVEVSKKTTQVKRKVVPSKSPSIDITPTQINELIRKQDVYKNLLSKNQSFHNSIDFPPFPSSSKHTVQKKTKSPQNTRNKKSEMRHESKALIVHPFLFDSSSLGNSKSVVNDLKTETEYAYPSQYLQKIKTCYFKVFREHFGIIYEEMLEMIPNRSLQDSIEKFQTMICLVEDDTFLSFLNVEECNRKKMLAQKALKKILDNEREFKKLLDQLKKANNRFKNVIESLPQFVYKITMNGLKKYTESIRSEKDELNALESDIEKLLLHPYTSHYTQKYLKYKEIQASKKLIMLEELLEKAKTHHNCRIQELIDQSMNCTKDIKQFIEKGSFYAKFSDHSTLSNILNPILEEASTLQTFLDNLRASNFDQSKSINSMIRLAKKIQHDYQNHFKKSIRLQKCYNILFEDWIDQNIDSSLKKKICRRSMLLKIRNSNAL